MNKESFVKVINLVQDSEDLLFNIKENNEDLFLDYQYFHVDLINVTNEFLKLINKKFIDTLKPLDDAIKNSLKTEFFKRRSDGKLCSLDEHRPMYLEEVVNATMDFYKEKYSDNYDYLNCADWRKEDNKKIIKIKMRNKETKELKEVEAIINDVKNYNNWKEVLEIIE